MNIDMYVINAVLILMVIRQIRVHPLDLPSWTSAGGGFGGHHGPHPGRRPCLIWYPGPPRVTLCP